MGMIFISCHLFATPLVPRFVLERGASFDVFLLPKRSSLSLLLEILSTVAIGDSKSFHRKGIEMLEDR